MAPAAPRDQWPPRPGARSCRARATHPAAAAARSSPRAASALDLAYAERACDGGNDQLGRLDRRQSDEGHAIGEITRERGRRFEPQPRLAYTARSGDHQDAHLALADQPAQRGHLPRTTEWRRRRWQAGPRRVAHGGEHIPLARFM